VSGHVPQDGPQEPAQPPEGRAGPSMPPDPFSEPQQGFLALHVMYVGMRRGGFTMVEACLIIAANIAVNARLNGGAEGS